MRIAVTDANIFIDLIKLQLHTHFFGLDLEIHTTLDVYNELYAEQQTILDIYRSLDKLTIHVLSSQEGVAISNTPYSKGLSFEDKSVLYLAEKLKALLLSTDKLSRNYAKSICIDCHGMLWILDQLVEKQQLIREVAILKLNELIEKNPIYRNNHELQLEISKRVKIWSKV